MKSQMLFLMFMMTVVLGVSGLGNSNVAKANTINILALDTSTFDTQVLGALTGTVFTEVSASAFMTVDLSIYDVFYVGSTFQDRWVNIPSQAALDALNTRADDIAEFVKTGHGIVALSEPIGVGLYTWLPTPVAPSSEHGDNISIVDPTHPVMSGLTNAGLSNWYTSRHNHFTDVGSYSVLATSGEQPVTLVGSFGAGKIVLSGQDADFHYVYPSPGQQVEFVQNAINWVAPKVIFVEIDIKPGSDPNPVNTGSNGLIPVAILTTDDFDAADVDPSTVTLSSQSVAMRGKADKLMARMEDVDADGDDDLLVQVETQVEEGESTWVTGEVKLTGFTWANQAIEGHDDIIVVPPE